MSRRPASMRREPAPRTALRTVLMIPDAPNAAISRSPTSIRNAIADADPQRRHQVTKSVEVDQGQGLWGDGQRRGRAFHQQEPVRQARERIEALPGVQPPHRTERARWRRLHGCAWYPAVRPVRRCPHDDLPAVDAPHPDEHRCRGPVVSGAVEQALARQGIVGDEEIARVPADQVRAEDPGLALQQSPRVKDPAVEVDVDARLHEWAPRRAGQSFGARRHDFAGRHPRWSILATGRDAGLGSASSSPCPYWHPHSTRIAVSISD